MRRWYVARTQIRAEEKAYFNLKRQGFTVFLPKYMKTRRHARKVDQVIYPLFPGYLFVEVDTDLQQWRMIRSTIGVSQLISFGDMPSPMPHGVVEEILEREDDRGVVALSAESVLRKGQKIEIVDGPLSEQLGLFVCIDGNERVTILLNLLGREVRVGVSCMQIKPAA
jgi:transcriptional antiterminator RfaH